MGSETEKPTVIGIEKVRGLERWAKVYLYGLVVWLRKMDITLRVSK